MHGIQKEQCLRIFASMDIPVYYLGFLFLLPSFCFKPKQLWNSSGPKAPSHLSYGSHQSARLFWKDRVTHGYRDLRKVKADFTEYTEWQKPGLIWSCGMRRESSHPWDLVFWWIAVVVAVPFLLFPISPSNIGHENHLPSNFLQKLKTKGFQKLGQDHSHILFIKRQHGA